MMMGGTMVDIIRASQRRKTRNTASLVYDYNSGETVATMQFTWNYFRFPLIVQTKHTVTVRT